MKLEVPKVYEALWKTDKQDIVEVSGRAAGKSRNTSDFVTLNGFINSDEDIVICRATTASMKDSIRNDIIASIELFNYRENAEVLASPHPITNITRGNKVYFLGIDGDEGERSKGFRPLRKIKYAVFEETQQLKDLNTFKQAVTTLSKHIAEDGKFIILYNPPAQYKHWINVEQRKWEKNERYEIIRPTYKDVWKYLTEKSKQEIIDAQHPDLKDYHDWYYLGIVKENYGTIFKNPNRQGKLSELVNGIAHIDAGYTESGDWTALTIGRKHLYNGQIKYTMFGIAWEKPVEELTDEIIDLCLKYRVSALYTETNADKGFVAKDIRRRLNERGIE